MADKCACPPSDIIWIVGGYLWLVIGKVMKIEKTKFSGHEAIELKTSRIRMRITTSMGPRIAFFGKTGGENLFWWKEKKPPKNVFDVMGGHRVWVTRPGADENEETYRPDNGQCEVRTGKDNVTVTSEEDPVFKTRRGIKLTVESENRLKVDQFITYNGSMLYSAGVWGLSCTSFAKGRAYAVPLFDDSPWDCFRYVIFRKWGGGIRPFTVESNSQFIFEDEMLIIKPKGLVTKRMLESHYGIMAMDAPDQDTTFIRKTDYKSGASYPLGCNFAFYVAKNNLFVEMETMSPEVTLKAGETVHSEETWILTDKALGTDSAEKFLKAI